MSVIRCDSRINQTIRLRDGRVLGFAEFGDPGGRPLFFFHGGGSTRLTRHPDDSIVEDLGIRLITMDRPGVGLSSFKRRRRLLDWPDDVRDLADVLGIDRFGVLGWSAGGPHALACAYRIPHRLGAAGVISGLAPLHWPGAATALALLCRRLSPPTRRLADLVHTPISRLSHRAFGTMRDAELSVAGQLDALAGVPVEVRAIHRQAVRDLIRAWEWARAVELAMLARPWGFKLEDIAMEVRLWYGAQDPTTPLFMAEFLARAIPRARLTVWPGEGHHAGFTHWREIVQALVM